MKKNWSLNIIITFFGLFSQVMFSCSSQNVVKDPFWCGEKLNLGNALDFIPAKTYIYLDDMLWLNNRKAILYGRWGYPKHGNRDRSVIVVSGENLKNWKSYELSEGSVNKCILVNDSVIYAVSSITGKSVVYKSSGKYEKWEKVFEFKGNIRNFQFFNDSLGMIDVCVSDVYYSYDIYITQDGGITWKNMDVDDYHKFFCMDKMVLISHYDGSITQIDLEKQLKQKFPPPSFLKMKKGQTTTYNRLFWRDSLYYALVQNENNSILIKSKNLVDYTVIKEFKSDKRLFTRTLFFDENITICLMEKYETYDNLIFYSWDGGKTWKEKILSQLDGEPHLSYYENPETKEVEVVIFQGNQIWYPCKDNK